MIPRRPSKPLAQTVQRDSSNSKPLAKTMHPNKSLSKQEVKPKARQLYDSMLNKKQTKKTTSKPTWTPKQDEPVAHWQDDMQLERMVSDRLQRELQQNILKNSQRPKENLNATGSKTLTSKIILPRLEGAKSMDEIDREMSRQLQLQLENEMQRHY